MLYQNYRLAHGTTKIALVSEQSYYVFDETAAQYRCSECTCVGQDWKNAAGFATDKLRVRGSFVLFVYWQINSFRDGATPPPFFFLSKKCTIQKWKGSTRKTWQIWKCTLRVQYSFLPHSFIFLTLAYFILRDSTSPPFFSSITHGSTCHSCSLAIHTTVWPALWWKSTGLSASSADTSHLYLSCFKSPIERRVPQIGVTQPFKWQQRHRDWGYPNKGKTKKKTILWESLYTLLVTGVAEFVNKASWRSSKKKNDSYFSRPKAGAHGRISNMLKNKTHRRKAYELHS